MLGSLDEADDAVQQAWMRASRSDLSGVENVGAWLTTVTSRVCLDMLRTRQRRGERPLSSALDAGPAPASVGSPPEDEAVMAESVGWRCSSCSTVCPPLSGWRSCCTTCSPCPSSRSPRWSTARRSRRRSWPAALATASAANPRRPAGPPDRAEHQAVVEAFLTASRSGDLDTLLRLLAPDVVRRADRVAVPAGTAPEVRGARVVAEETRVFAARCPPGRRRPGRRHTRHRGGPGGPAAERPPGDDRRRPHHGTRRDRPPGSAGVGGARGVRRRGFQVTRAPASAVPRQPTTLRSGGGTGTEVGAS
jgi:Sigma-70 region 2